MVTRSDHERLSPGAPNFLNVPHDIIDEIYKLVAQESPSICLYSTRMTWRQPRTLHALSLVSKEIRSEFNKILAKVNGPVLKLPQDIDVWAYYQYSMQINTIEQYNQICGYLHDGHTITNKPFVLEVDISMSTSLHCVREILQRLQVDWSHNPELVGASIKFSVATTLRWRYQLYNSGLVMGHWKFSRSRNGIWEGKVWKKSKESPQSICVEYVEDISSGAWPIDARSLALYYEGSR